MVKLAKSNPVSTTGEVLSIGVVSKVGSCSILAKSNPVSTVCAGKLVILNPVSTTGVLSTFCKLTKSNWLSVTAGVVVS